VEFKNLVNTLQTKYLSQQQRSKKINGLIDLLEKIRDNIKDFYEDYRQYKEDFAHDEASINSHYNEPLKSYLLKILKEKGEREIEKKASSTYNEYLQYYRQYLRSNRQTIIKMVKKNNQKKISRIFNEMESLLHSFWI
jgi:superfamily II DNA or RNA helicase